MKALLELLQDFPAVKALSTGQKRIIANDRSQEALLIAASFWANKQKMIIVKNNLFAAQQLYERLEGLVNYEHCLFFPVDESFRIEALASSPELLTQRLYVLDKLLTEENYLLITHTAAISRLLPTYELFKASQIDLQVNSQLNLEEFMAKLVSIGYQRVNKITHSLEFARRGGVLDIYSVNNELPLRIEFFGDEIESIRFFDLDSQRTVKMVDKAKIIAATDLIVDETYYQSKLNELRAKLDTASLDYEHKVKDLESLSKQESYSTLYKYYSQVSKKVGCLFDYAKEARVIYSHLKEIQENFRLLTEESFEYLKEREDTSFILHFPLSTVLNKIPNKTSIEIFRRSESDVEFPLREVEGANGNAQQLKLIVEEYLRRHYRLILCLDNPNQIACVKNWFKDWGYELSYYDGKKSLPRDSLSYSDFPFKEGFELVNEGYIFLSPLEIFGQQLRSRRSYTRYRDAQVLQSYDNLDLGDYVVHEVYGIGQFLGIKTIENQGIHRDYLHIAYRNNEDLYVPLAQFKVVRKYVSKQGASPRLSKLGSNEWLKTKTKIKQRIGEISDRLMSLYLKRSEKVGFACAPDEEWQRQFENSFPYELTRDQKRAVQEIKEDMEKPYPMDRLLCGDVGFGKTEVAFIAAFKAILNGKQVALLCPTTILARQHYEVAKERFQNFPINIGVLSRLVPLSEQNKYLDELQKGELNFLIGTHRLLSKDVEFKDLGLLIVDEEQRFGVEHKEKIKELKESIDVLTLSATPIPRTLQTALIGLKSFSQIDTPPRNRMPIQTYVLEKSERLIKEIIERELSRHGQVFYLHNRISDIFTLANKVRKMVPAAKVIVVHGRMNHEQIEDAMIDFNKGLANVMICTTIIENGLDIPSANTIIVEDSDRFGLAQLYQIKGRVGRGDRLAYAYLFYNPKKILNPAATKRLSAIKEFVELGSGYRIALRDLSIRGAGDILGSEQAGFIETVGMDMYLHLLQEALKEKETGIVEESTKKLALDYRLDAYLPEHFTADDLDKIDVYKKMAEVKNSQQLEALEEEMIDVYGRLPKSVKLLLEKRRFEIFIDNDLIEEIKDFEDFYELVLGEKVSKFDGIGFDIFRLCDEISRDILVSYRQGRVRIRLAKKDKNWLEYANRFLKDLKGIVQKYERLELT